MRASANCVSYTYDARSNKGVTMIKYSSSIYLIVVHNRSLEIEGDELS